MAVIIGAVNAIVKLIAEGLSGCLILLTWGCSSWSSTPPALMFSAWLAGQLGIAFTVDG